MIITLVFHRVTDQNDPSVYEQFRDFLEDIANRYPIILPGERVPCHKVGVCLTFDDAYADFYWYVYPLLKQLNIRAVLGIIPSYMTDSTSMTVKDRMQRCEVIAFEEVTSEFSAQFCTWQEIDEMVDSSYVIPASHSMNHVNARCETFDSETELGLSQQTIAHKVGYSPDCFIYPYGNYDAQNHVKAQQYYRFMMRIGAALNFTWYPKTRLLYRVDSDPFWRNNQRLRWYHILGWVCKTLINRLRGK